MAEGDRTITVAFLADMSPLSAAFAEINAKIIGLGAGGRAPAFATELEAGVKKIDTAVSATARTIDAVVNTKAPAVNFATELEASVKQAEEAIVEMGKVIDMTVSKRAPGLIPGVNPRQAAIDAEAAARGTTGRRGGTSGMLTLEQSAAMDAAAAEAAAMEKAAAGGGGKGGGGGGKEIAQAGEEFEKAEGKARSFRSEIGRMRTDWFLLLGVFAAGKVVVDAAADKQTAQRLLGNVMGDRGRGDQVFGQLGKVSDETNYSVTELAKSAKSLVEAGDAPDKLSEHMQSLAIVARTSGSSLEEITEIYSRLELRGTLTIRELTRLTLAGGAATRGLAEEYRNLENNIKSAGEILKGQAEAEKQAFAAQEKHIGAVDSITKKIGLASGIYQAWVKDMNKTSVDSAAGFSGSAIGKISKAEIEEYNDAVKEVASTLNVSKETAQGFFKSGQLGYEDAIQYAKEYRDAIQKVKEENQQKAEALNVSTGHQEEIEVFKKVEDALTNLKTSESGFQEYQGSFAGQMDKQAKQLNETLANIGTPLIENFHKVEIAIGLVAAAFVALKSVEIFKGVAGTLELIATKFGGVEAAANGAAAAEARAAAAGTGVGGAALPAAGATTAAAGVAAETPIASLVASTLVMGTAINEMLAYTKRQHEGQKEEERSNDNWVDKNIGGPLEAFFTHLPVDITNALTGRKPDILQRGKGGGMEGMQAGGSDDYLGNLPVDLGQKLYDIGHQVLEPFQRAQKMTDASEAVSAPARKPVMGTLYTMPDGTTTLVLPAQEKKTGSGIDTLNAPGQRNGSYPGSQYPGSDPGEAGLQGSALMKYQIASRTNDQTSALAARSGDQYAGLGIPNPGAPKEGKDTGSKLDTIAQHTADVNETLKRIFGPS